MQRRCTRHIQGIDVYCEGGTLHIVSYMQVYNLHNYNGSSFMHKFGVHPVEEEQDNVLSKTW